MEGPARAGHDPGGGLRLEWPDFRQPIPDRQGDDGDQLERPSLLRASTGKKRRCRNDRSQDRRARPSDSAGRRTEPQPCSWLQSLFASTSFPQQVDHQRQLTAVSRISRAKPSFTSLALTDIVRVNSILPARPPGRAGAPLFLLTNYRRARPDSTPKVAYTYCLDNAFGLTEPQGGIAFAKREAADAY